MSSLFVQHHEPAPKAKRPVPRDYQVRFVNAILEALEEKQSTLGVAPTGTGKTVTLCELINRFPGAGKVLIIAHREELIFQAANAVERATGTKAGIEMAEFTTSDRHRVTVATIQSLISGKAGNERYRRFIADAYGLVIIDEAHHACANSYKGVLDYFRSNPGCKIYGTTATPDRADEAALGQVFESVAFNYEITDAIDDGWLVNIQAQEVMVSEMDLSEVHTVAGDFNGEELSEILEKEEVLHGIADPLYRLTPGKKVLVFAKSVEQAERLAEILNRHEANCARWVCGKTPKDERRKMFADYSAGVFRILVNVAVLTEGWDESSVEVVAMAAPTKSRCRYAQCVGRGTRPLPGVVDVDGYTAEDRRHAIASSAKPSLMILDFVGNAGKHKLIGPADLLGGKYPEEIIDAAKKQMTEDGTTDVREALKRAAQAEIDRAKKEREERERAEEQRRAGIKIKAKYATAPVEVFSIFGVAPPREMGWDTGRKLTDKQVAMLQKQGIDTGELTYAQGKALCDELFRRWDNKLSSMRQAKLLQKFGIDASNMSHDEASAAITKIKNNGWRKPYVAQIDPSIERF